MRCVADEPPPPPRGLTAQERAAEPPQPQRGLTAEERGPDKSGPELELEAATTLRRKVWILVKPSFLASQVSGYPVGIKQFLWLCLVIIYPAWLFMVLVGYPVVWVIGKVLYGIFWVLFWPVRALFKRGETEESPQPPTAG